NSGPTRLLVRDPRRRDEIRPRDTAGEDAEPVAKRPVAPANEAVRERALRIARRQGGRLRVGEGDRNRRVELDGGGHGLGDQRLAVPDAHLAVALDSQRAVERQRRAQRRLHRPTEELRDRGGGVAAVRGAVGAAEPRGDRDRRVLHGRHCRGRSHEVPSRRSRGGARFGMVVFDQEAKTMRIALAQINTVVGDLEGNRQRIESRLEEARGEAADLVLFPELAVTGYPPEDLLLRPGFIRAARRTLDEIARATRNVVALVGVPILERDLYNACAVCTAGEVKALYRKHFLPNYAVLD